MSYVSKTLPREVIIQGRRCDGCEKEEYDNLTHWADLRWLGASGLPKSYCPTCLKKLEPTPVMK